MAEARSISMPPNFSGIDDGGQAQLGRLCAAPTPPRPASWCWIVLEIRLDFLRPELIGGARDGAMLFGEVLGREDFRGRALLDQECAAFGFR